MPVIGTAASATCDGDRSDKLTGDEKRENGRKCLNGSEFDRKHILEKPMMKKTAYRLDTTGFELKRICIWFEDEI